MANQSYPFRGIVLGLLLSLPVWAAIIFGVSYVIQAQDASQEKVRKVQSADETKPAETAADDSAASEAKP